MYYKHSDKAIPYKKNLIKRARELRKNPSIAENKMWSECLGKKQFLGLKFTRQKPLLNYIVDFYCSELGLVIELDGDSHALQKNYDKKRTKDLEQYGLKIIRYINSDVMCNIDSVYKHLYQFVEKLKKE